MATDANMNRSTRKVTPMELLTVCGIIAFTAYILFPMFAKARERYPRSTCPSNIKQLGIGLIQYVADYDEQYPVNGCHGTGWAAALYPYEKLTGVFRCPNDTAVAVTTNESTSYPLSYSMNANLVYFKDRHEVAFRQRELARLEATVLLFETDGTMVDMTKPDEGGAVSPTGFHSGVGNGLSPMPGTGNLTANGNQIRYACGEFPGRGPGTVYGPPRHDPSSVFLCADGHVKMLRPEKISTGRTPAKSATQTGNAVSGTAATSDRLTDGGFTLTFSTR
ncbi:MAG TPA: hypothetical protein VGK19_17500 [Capsulimonadaceae bacterium]|jgi:hypothetical protein